MSFIATATAAVERLPLPDPVTLAGVEFLVGRTGRKLAREPENEEAFARTMRDFPIAIHTSNGAWVVSSWKRSAVSRQNTTCGARLATSTSEACWLGA